MTPKPLKNGHVFNDKIIRMPEIDYNDSKESLGQVFFNQMRRNRHKIAQYIAETGEADTFSDLLQRSIRVALKMRDEGLTRGDIISICSHNHKNCSTTFIAATFLGITLASFEPQHSHFNTAHLIKTVKPKRIFVSSELIELIEDSTKLAEIFPKIVVFGQHDQYQSFDEYLKPHREENEFKPVAIPSTETVVILFSSGTTGAPKGICHGSSHFLSGVHNKLSLRSVDGCILSFGTLYSYVTVFYLIFSIVGALPRLICKSFDPVEMWKNLDVYKVQGVFITPYIAIQMIKAGKPEKNDYSHIEYVSIGGASLSERYMKELRTILPHTLVAQAYGQSEAGYVFMSWDPKTVGLVDFKLKSSGTSLPGMWYKVVDPKTEEILGPNRQGELRLKSKYLMNGYYNRDSSSAFDSEGWLKTEDVVYYDEDRYFYLVDRLKEFLRFRGVDVSPAHLENVIESCPGVVKAAVIGIPHEVDGEHPMAVVQMADGSAVTGRQIEDFVNSRVGEGQKLRGGVKFIEELPISPTHKTDKRLIKEMVLSGLI